MTLGSLLRSAHARLFLPLDRGGVHLLPKHYYSPVPDYRWLDQHPESWRRPVSLAGVEWDLGAQLAWLRETCTPFLDEVAGRAEDALGGAGLGLGYGRIEAKVLWSVIRARGPMRVVEVGGGVSTGIVVEAGRRNRRPPAVTTIEPLPRSSLAALPGIELVRERAQDVDPTVFAQLTAGDVLFIDSSHVVKTGSELARLYLEIVPSLPPGVLVHVHDVTLPFLYHRTFGRDFYDWQETTLALALLKGNRSLAVRCCLSALHYERRRELVELFPDYRPQPDAAPGLAAELDGDFPSSLWLESV